MEKEKEVRFEPLENTIVLFGTRKKLNKIALEIIERCVKFLKENGKK